MSGGAIFILLAEVSCGGVDSECVAVVEEVEGLLVDTSC